MQEPYVFIAIKGVAVGALGSHTGEQIGTLLYKVSGSGQ